MISLLEETINAQPNIIKAQFDNQLLLFIQYKVCTNSSHAIKGGNSFTTFKKCILFCIKC